jgi:hypothetical protein
MSQSETYKYLWRPIASYGEVCEMKLTTIQVREETRRELERRKSHPRETYDAVINRTLQDDDGPSLEEMFRICDSIPDRKKYTAQQIVKLGHELRDRGWKN